jgi:hypothetical protein
LFAAGGATGPTGAAGATGATGQGYTSVGLFDPTLFYPPYTVVLDANGSSYTTTRGTVPGGVDPSTNPAWFVFAAGGATGATGPAGPAGANGAPGPTGATGAAGPAGSGSPGQVWTASIAMPVTYPDGIVTFVGAPMGASAGTSASGNGFVSYAVPVPQNCTASNFLVTLFQGQFASSANVVLVVETQAQLGVGTQFGDLVSAISCTVTNNSAAPVSCASQQTYPLTTSDYISVVITAPGSTPLDYEGSTVNTSFVCQ